MRFIILVVLALATSLDSMGVGFAFGLKGTHLRASAHAVISLVMLAITGASVAIGNRMADILSDRLSHDLSAFLFVAVGIGMLAPLARAFRAGHFTCNGDSAASVPCPLVPAGRQVGLLEASVLGVMLSINNIGGGISAGLIHLDPSAMALVSVFFNIALLIAGHSMGACLRRTPIKNWAQIMAAMTMVAVGIYQLR